MLEEYRSDSLFATPLLRFRFADHAALDAGLLEVGRKMQADSPGVDKSNRGGWHSAGNFFDDPSEPVQTLRDAAEAAIGHAMAKARSKADPDELDLKLFAWMNINPVGGFNAPHTHPGAHWSGVYYVAQPEVETGNSGMIEFLDPRTDLPHWRLLKAKPFRTKRKLRPGAGEMVLFPSYLVHWVYPNESGEERVTIAFNATFSKKRKRKAGQPPP